MKNAAKAAIGATAVLILAVGGEVLWLHHERNAPVAVKAPEREVMADDDLVYLKKKRPDTLKEIKDLKGSTLWVSAGGQLDYYPYVGHGAQYGKSAGTLLGAEPIVAKDAIEQVAPKNATFRIPGGDKQVLLVFTKPDDTKEYAVPVGYRQAGQYTFLTDEVFFYDDPHVLYKHWGPDVWAHIDKHEAALGMSENQAMMALGQTINPHGDNVGDRSVTFDNSGHPVTIDFQNNKAVKITPE